jgi:hypothetical protein
MIRRWSSRFSLLLAALVACASLTVAVAQPASADVTTHTPVMGPSLLTAAQLAAWYHRHSGNSPKIPALGNDVGRLAQVFIDEGNAEGVRGDIAFVQSMLETGWLGFAGSQITPYAYNYAGIYAFDGRAGLPNVNPCVDPTPGPSRCMGTPQHGVLMQIQLLRSYADPSVKNKPGRLISAPSDRAGLAPLWEYFGGHNCPCGKLIWASADDYGLTIIRMYSGALAESGKAGACVPYAPAHPGPTSGTGYWQVATDKIVRPFGTAHFYGDLRSKPLARGLIGGESTHDAGGYWLLGGDGGIFSFGDAHFWGSTGAKPLNAPINGMERTSNSGGYWLVANDGGIFTFGNAHFYGSTGGHRLNKPIMGMERTPSNRGYWLFASDGGIFRFGDAGFYGSLGGNPPSSPVVSMQRTATGRGYWMMTQDGRVFRFGDAVGYGDLAGCTGMGPASRMLVTPSGHGYWIMTLFGAVVAFGDAKTLGFPASIGGWAIAFLGAN